MIVHEIQEPKYLVQSTPIKCTAWLPPIRAVTSRASTLQSHILFGLLLSDAEDDKKIIATTHVFKPQLPCDSNLPILHFCLRSSLLCYPIVENEKFSFARDLGFIVREGRKKGKVVGGLERYVRGTCSPCYPSLNLSPIRVSCHKLVVIRSEKRQKLDRVELKVGY